MIARGSGWWTRNRALSALRRFIATHDRPPTSRDFLLYPDELPTTGTLYRLFGTLPAYLAAGGIPVSRAAARRSAARGKPGHGKRHHAKAQPAGNEDVA